MRETARKTVHIIFGLAIALFILAAPRNDAITVLALAVLSGFVLSDILRRGYPVPFVSRLVDELDRKDTLPGRGALYFAVSALCCLVFFPAAIVVPAVVTLSILDGVATLAGRWFGRIRIVNGKTLEGSAAGMIVTFFPLLLFLPVPGAAMAVLTGGVIELVSPVDDNLVIPPGVCLALTLLPV